MAYAVGFRLLLQYFSVLAILEGFKWTIEKSYIEFVNLHKSVRVDFV